MAEHPNYVNSQLEANSRRVVNFNRYSGVAETGEASPMSKTLSPKKELPDGNISSVRSKSASSALRSTLPASTKHTTRQVDNFFAESSDASEPSNQITGIPSTESDEVYIRTMESENTSMMYNKFSDLDGGDYHLHHSTLWLLEQATTATSTPPGGKFDGVIFFHSPEKFKKISSRNEDISKTKKSVPSSPKQFSEIQQNPLKGLNLSKSDFDMDLTKSDKHVSPYLQHTVKKSKRLMSAPPSRSLAPEITQPEQSNQQQSKSGKGTERLIRSAVSKSTPDIQKHLPVITTSSIQKEMPKVFGILAADDIEDKNIRNKLKQKEKAEESLYIETPSMRKLDKDYSRAGSPGKIVKPADTALNTSVSTFFFPTSSSPKNTKKYTASDLNFSFQLSEYDAATIKSRQLDKSWQMDPNFVAYHNHLIASIVNPIHAQKRYRFSEDQQATTGQADTGAMATTNSAKSIFQQFQLPSITNKSSNLSHNDPLYKLLIDEIPNVKKSFQLFDELSAIKDFDPLGGEYPTALTDVRIGNKKLSKQKMSSINSVRVSPADLKMLSSFQVLPPAMWVTARIVYFLFLAYFRVVINDEESAPIRNYLSIDTLWSVLGGHFVTDGLSVETVEKKFSWPLLQALLNYPIMFSKALQLIEHGPPDFVLLDSNPPVRNIVRSHQNATDMNSNYSLSAKSLSAGYSNIGSSSVTAQAVQGVKNAISSHRYLFYDKFPISMLAPLRRLVVHVLLF